MFFKSEVPAILTTHEFSQWSLKYTLHKSSLTRLSQVLYIIHDTEYNMSEHENYHSYVWYDSLIIVYTEKVDFHKKT